MANGTDDFDSRVEKKLHRLSAKKGLSEYDGEEADDHYYNGMYYGRVNGKWGIWGSDGKVLKTFNTPDEAKKAIDSIRKR